MPLALSRQWPRLSCVFISHSGHQTSALDGIDHPQRARVNLPPLEATSPRNEVLHSHNNLNPRGIEHAGPVPRCDSTQAVEGHSTRKVEAVVFPRDHELVDASLNAIVSFTLAKAR